MGNRDDDIVKPWGGGKNDTQSSLNERGGTSTVRVLSDFQEGGAVSIDIDLRWNTMRWDAMMVMYKHRLDSNGV